VSDTIRTYDRIAPAYAERNFNLAFDVEREEFARAIIGNAPAERFRILDAGCGPGRDSKWFHERGFQVIGVDLSQGMLAEARRRVPAVDFRQADLRGLDFPDGYFDGIWCCASLLHLPRADVPAVLASFNRLLGHGFLRLSVKAGQGEEVVDGAYGPDTPREITYFSRCELELLLERSGFDVHRVTEDEPTPMSPHPWLAVVAQTQLNSPLVGAVWNLPSGIVDADESPEEAVVRETKEETGLYVEVIRFIGVGTSSRVYRGFGPAVQGNIVSHAYLCRVVGGELTLTTEALQHGWFKPDALPSPMAARRHVDLVETAVAMRRGRVPWPIARRYGASRQ
jgi:SAM-dependent methyltransferase